MNDQQETELASTITEAARSIVPPPNPSKEFVESVRELYGSNLSMFIRLGFDLKTAKFLAAMLAARMINDELGADMAGRA
ncbi:hypothetical protein [Methylocystis sp. SB2]|uniref:hypothetical protein n=1 Tax=Methylocystis sp. (strain SB2) TaxID=743836 RepID=UPI0003FD7D33|nr:hypothetical protein [Methylocystis sp. SB2]ULO22979.1 hypothetical protein LNB28_12510 [Methylocystis sp. SB2]